MISFPFHKWETEAYSSSVLTTSLFWPIRASVTKYHRLGGLETTEIDFSPFGDCKSEIKLLADSSSGGVSPLGYRWRTSLRVLTWQEESQTALRGLFCKDTDSIHEAPPHDLIISQRPHRLTHWGAAFQHVHLVGETDIQSVAILMSKRQDYALNLTIFDSRAVLIHTSPYCFPA